MKILVLRFSSIGDIVLCSPVVRCLKNQLGAEVHFLTKAGFAPIFEANPYVDKVLTFQKEIGTELLDQLRAARYDQVIDLHHNLRSLRVKLALGRPAHAFDKLNWEKWLLVQFKINRMPATHIVHRYMDTVKGLGVAYDDQGLDYFIPASVSLGNIPLPEAPFTAFAIGATHATKRLPDDKIIALCQNIQQPIVLLGGKTEEASGLRIAQQIGPRATNLCGQLSLHQSAAVVRAAFQVYTHDTGLMHIAAALRKPIVSIWGSTVPAFGMWPFYPTGMDLNTSLERTGLNCRPCSKIGYDHCPKGHFKCMQTLDIQAIPYPSDQNP